MPKIIENFFENNIFTFVHLTSSLYHFSYTDSMVNSYLEEANPHSRRHVDSPILFNCTPCLWGPIGIAFHTVNFDIATNFIVISCPFLDRRIIVLAWLGSVNWLLAIVWIPLYKPKGLNPIKFYTALSGLIPFSYCCNPQYIYRLLSNPRALPSFWEG